MNSYPLDEVALNGYATFNGAGSGAMDGSASGRAATVARGTVSAANMQMAASWAGLMDVTPDAVPVISTVEDIPGLVIATGFSGHGFGIGPGAGRLAADLAVGSEPVVDPTPFRFSRFSDGTKIRVEAGF